MVKRSLLKFSIFKTLRFGTYVIFLNISVISLYTQKKRMKKERICGRPCCNYVGHSGTGQETNFCKGWPGSSPSSVHLEVGLVGPEAKGQLGASEPFLSCLILFISMTTPATGPYPDAPPGPRE